LENSHEKIALAALILAVSAAAASAADMAPAPVYTKAPVVVAPIYNWTGFYIGANAGGAWGNSDPRTSTVFSPTGYFEATSVPAVNAVGGSQRINDSGFTGGLTAGYNWQAGAAVVVLNPTSTISAREDRRAAQGSIPAVPRLVSPSTRRRHRTG
jgi:outer membrane immunogenic protein